LLVIPTVLDRLIRRAIVIVLTPIIPEVIGTSADSAPRPQRTRRRASSLAATRYA